jgi:hypothetical protein
MWQHPTVARPVTAPHAVGYLRTSASPGKGNTSTTVSVIYTTDLFHPPDFLDDQTDLATLFALSELDVRAIVLEQGYRQYTRSGATPVKQLLALTGRQIPYAVGLAHPLRYPEDKCLQEHPLLQKGVELILQTLRETPGEVYLIAVGSARDTAAAFNRAEKLFRDKVTRVYLNIGNLPGGDLEWNAALDPQAYIRLMQSNLPIYWCPCLGSEGTYELMAAGKLKVQQRQTHWMFRHGEVCDSLPTRMQNYFLYAAGQKDPKTEDPIAYLEKVPDKELIQRHRNDVRETFSTASLLDASGRQLHRKGDTWAALTAPAPGFQLLQVFDFLPARVSIDRDLRTPLDFSNPSEHFKVFHLKDLENYEKAMTTSLRRLLVEMPLSAVTAPGASCHQFAGSTSEA